MSHQRALSDLRTAIRDNVDEATASFWTNAQLLRYINRAINRVWTETKRLHDDYFAVQRTSTDGTLTILGESYAASSFAIVAGTRNYTLPPDFAELRIIEVTTSGYEDVRFIFKPLTDPEMRAARELIDQQAPAQFLFSLIGERTLAIAPLSNTALDLRLTYIRRLADLSADADTVELPYELCNAVEAYATASGMLQDRNAPQAAIWEARGRQTVTDFMSSNARQSQDPVFVESALHDYTGW